LQPEDFAGWLDGSAGTELLKPVTKKTLFQVWYVSKPVNHRAMMKTTSGRTH
jgi:hypothetical protein